jgi:hypothetical protein
MTAQAKRAATWGSTILGAAYFVAPLFQFLLNKNDFRCCVVRTMTINWLI